MENISRKGGKLDALWTGPYRIDAIDCHQRVSLVKLNGDVLNAKVPYDQIKRHVAGDLHKLNSKENNEVKEEPCQSAGQSDVIASEISKAQLQTSIENNKNKNDVVCCGERKREKRPIGPLPVTPALNYKDIAKLLPVIKNGKWLTDEHIDNAQAILADYIQQPRFGKQGKASIANCIHADAHIFMSYNTVG